MEKKFNIGLLVDDFQPFTGSHKEILEAADELCDIIVIAVSSADKSGTSENPLTYELRKKVIVEFAESLTADVIVMPLIDMVDPEDNGYAWGDYLMSAVRTELLRHRIDAYAEIVFYPNILPQNEWYNESVKCYLTEFRMKGSSFPLAPKAVRNIIRGKSVIPMSYLEILGEYSQETRDEVIDVISKTEEEL